MRRVVITGIGIVSCIGNNQDEALESLEADHEFLLKGDVFTQDVIDTWIEYKRENDIADVRLRPHPIEFFLYYDV